MKIIYSYSVESPEQEYTGPRVRGPLVQELPEVAQFSVKHIWSYIFKAAENDYAIVRPE